MLFGMREGERFIDATIALNPESGFSVAYFTTDSRFLSLEFGLRLGEQPSPQAQRKLRLARLFKIGSMETNKVVHLFLEAALKTGWFAALPYEEIPNATKGIITNRDLEVAVEEGFLQRTFYPGVEVELAELTPIIVP